MHKLRRTKILVTLGPACDDANTLINMIKAGVDAVRINFSHGEIDDHQRRVECVHQCASELNKQIAILADLQGPKIRIARFRENKIQLKQGSEFTLDAELKETEGDKTQVGIDYKQLPEDVKAGDRLLLDDGRIRLIVKQIASSRILCEVEVGGELSNNKGINRLGGGLSATALTAKDKKDLITAVSLGADYLALSFPRDANDIDEARRLLQQANSTMHIIAKIERTEAVNNIDSIINAADGVMVARGDLGVEIGDAELVVVQKHIIQRARALDKPVITATQMMESMVNSPVPTRAEVSDVANAVLDGTDTVMLSAESATGLYPIETVAALDRVCRGAERQKSTLTSKHRVECQFKRVDEAIAMAAMYTANHFANVQAIIALTESGSTPLWMSRIRSGIPIFAFSRHLETERRVMLYRGVYPVHFDPTQYTEDSVNDAAVQCLVDTGFLVANQWVLLTRGDIIGVDGHSNSMKLLQAKV